MDRKREIFEKVLALVRNELWDEPLTCSIAKEDVADILIIAREQMVSGLVANAIVRNQLPIGEDLTLEVMGILKLHEKKGREMNAEVAQFAGFLNRRNLQYVIMKGQTMAVLYPNPLMRSTGDIDFYCPKESFESTQKEIEKRLGIVMKHASSKKHDNFEIEGFSFEMHSDITDFGYWGYQRYWDTYINKEVNDDSVEVLIGEEKVKTLSPTMDALYIFLHAFYHLILNGNGMGLKQYCDWCMVMSNLYDKIDFERLKVHLDHLGLWKAYLAIAAFCVGKLGLAENYVHFPLTKDGRKWADKIIDNFLEIRIISENVYSSGGSLKHSFATFRVVLKQVSVYFSLAPKELMFRIPEMAVWSFRKRMME